MDAISTPASIALSAWGTFAFADFLWGLNTDSFAHFLVGLGATVAGVLELGHFGVYASVVSKEREYDARRFPHRIVFQRAGRFLGHIASLPVSLLARIPLPRFIEGARTRRVLVETLIHSMAHNGMIGIGEENASIRQVRALLKKDVSQLQCRASLVETAQDFSKEE